MSSALESSSQRDGSTAGGFVAVAKDSPAPGDVVMANGKIVAYVTFAAQGMVAVETTPARPRPKNWFTDKEWLATDYTILRDAGKSEPNPLAPG